MYRYSIRSALLGAAVLSVFPLGIGAQAQTASAPEPAAATSSLRVCADPDYLPFSNRDGQGFENKVAEVVAQALGRKLTYVWASERGQGGYPNFLADNLDGGKCDVVMSLPYGDQEEGYTQSYYRSAYVFVVKKSDRRAVTAMTSPALRGMKIGVQDDTTPVEAIKMLGLVDNAVSFDVASSPGVSPKILLDAVQSGKVDVTVTWQPAIGAFLKDYPDLQVREVPPEEYGPGLPQVAYAYEIAMGVRKDDTALRDALNKVIATHKTELADALTQGGVRFYTGHLSVGQSF